MSVDIQVGYMAISVQQTRVMMMVMFLPVSLSASCMCTVCLIMSHLVMASARQHGAHLYWLLTLNCCCYKPMADSNKSHNTLFCTYIHTNCPFYSPLFCGRSQECERGRMVSSLQYRGRSLHNYSLLV